MCIQFDHKLNYVMQKLIAIQEHSGNSEHKMISLPIIIIEIENQINSQLLQF